MRSIPAPTGDAAYGRGPRPGGPPASSRRCPGEPKPAGAHGYAGDHPALQHDRLLTSFASPTAFTRVGLSSGSGRPPEDGLKRSSHA